MKEYAVSYRYGAWTVHIKDSVTGDIGTFPPAPSLEDALQAIERETGAPALLKVLTA